MTDEEKKPHALRHLTDDVARAYGEEVMKCRDALKSQLANILCWIFPVILDEIAREHGLWQYRPTQSALAASPAPTEKK